MYVGELLTDIVNWMSELSPLWAYAVILGIAYGENLIPPVPGDMVVVFGGVLVGRGVLSYPVVVFLATVGGAAGFMTVYALGYRLGETVLAPDRFTWLPQRQVDRAQRWVQRWGYGVVLANRFLSGARSVISLTVGMAHMDPWKTTAAATVSAAVWTALITYAGYVVGDNWRLVGDFLRDYGQGVLIALGIVIAIQLLRLYFRRRSRRDAPPPANKHDASGSA